MSAPAIALTAAGITDARLDAISRAREVLERTRSECRAWRGGGTALCRVTVAAAALEGALRGWDRAGRDERDEAARMAGHWTAEVIAVVDARFGREAAAYVSGGDDSSSEGDEAA